MSRLTTKPASIRPVWSKSSVYAQWVAKDPSFIHADSENSDHTWRIWVFAGRTCHFVGFVMRRLMCCGQRRFYRVATTILFLWKIEEIYHLIIIKYHYLYVILWLPSACRQHKNTPGFPVSHLLHATFVSANVVLWHPNTWRFHMHRIVLRKSFTISCWLLGYIEEWYAVAIGKAHIGTPSWCTSRKRGIV